jgi:methylphosphotriester-DNA--protein-cysteine methyltransferase
MLSYREYAPQPSLASLIQSCWTLRDTTGSTETQRIVPDGHPELILNLGAPFEAFRHGKWRLQPQCFLAGQLEGPLLLRPTGPADMIGIRFRPDGAAQVFGDRMQETTGRFTPVDDLAPVLARECERAVGSSDIPGEVQRIFSRTARRRQDDTIAAAVRQMTESRGAVDLVQLARNTGLSLRQFERRFAAVVGLPPKLFCKMQRFVHVFHFMSEPGAQWIDAALESGYCDQSHLIRDCKQFSGHTPAALLGPDGDLARHFYQRFGMSHSSKTTTVGRA